MYFDNKKGLKAETIGDAGLPNIDKILFDVDKFIAMIEAKTGKPISALVRASINSAISEIKVQYTQTDYELNLAKSVRESSDKIRQSINTIHANLKDLVQGIIDEKPDRTSAELKDELLNRTSDKFSKVYTVSRINAIAQTTSNFAFNSAQNKVYIDFGLEKTWLSQRDSKVRTTHRFADSQKADENGFFYVGNDKMQHPNQGTIASENVHCRCYMLARKKANAPTPEPVPTAEPKPVKPRKPRTPKPKPVTPAGLNSIDDILTVSDANKYLLEKHSIENLNTGINNVDAFKLFLSELETMKKEFNGLDSIRLLTETSDYNTFALAHSRHNVEIGLNRRHFNNLELLEVNYKDMTRRVFKQSDAGEIYDFEMNFHPKNTDYKSIITHELGHTLSSFDILLESGFGKELKELEIKYIAEITPKIDKTKELIDLWNNEKLYSWQTDINGNWLSDELKELKKQKRLDVMKQLEKSAKELDEIYVSKYADENTDEFVASAFALGYTKPNQNKYGDAVVSIIKKYKGK